jgi:hypothetical protein
MRHLPLATAEANRAAARWDARRGVIAANLIVVAALLAWVAWSWWTGVVEPRFDPEVHVRAVDENLKKVTPAEAWQWWIEYYRPRGEHGIPVFQAANLADIRRLIAHQRFLRWMILSVAGVFALTAAAAYFWPAIGKTGRQGDKETRRMR